MGGNSSTRTALSLSRWALALLLIAIAVAARSAGLFDSDSVLDVELRGPLQQTFNDPGNRPYSFQLAAEGLQQPVSVTADGNSRRRICSFPPLKLLFDTDESDGASVGQGIFAGQEFVRITTHCQGRRSSRANVIEEYLAYRIFTVITDFSYRVRLLRVKYIDTARDNQSEAHYAFAIESENQMAARLGGQVLKIKALPKSRLNEQQAALAYIFEYLIGNTDWSLVAGSDDKNCCHNGQLVGIDDEILYVPYDFDQAGLVNPRYAKPDPSLRIERVTQRLYRGYCGPPEALREALTHIINKRQSILDVVRQAPALNAKDRNRDIRYLEGFFRKARNPEALLETFQKLCLG